MRSPSPQKRPLWLLCFALFCSLGIALPLLAFTCAQEPDCRSDAECINRLGNSFACILSVCRDRSNLPEKPTFEIPPDEPTPEEQAPEPEREITPEPEITPEEEPDTQPTPDGTRRLFETCLLHPTATVGERCQRGLRCVRVDPTETRCLQDCSTNPSICATNADGRVDCAIVSYDRDTLQPIRACVKFVQKDQSCDLRQSNLCARNQIPSLSCQNGVCRENRLITSQGGDCSPGQSPPTECDANNGLACANESTCIPGVVAFEGDQCSLATTPGLRRLCVAGTSCVTFNNNGQSIGICLKRCELSNPIGSCIRAGVPDMYCRAFGISGFCVQRDCESQQQCRNESYSTECTGTTDATRTKICFPQMPNGPILDGEICSATDSARFCKHPATCALTTVVGERREGYCTRQCRNDQDCAGLPNNPVCNLSRTDGIRFCGFRCSANNPSCPSPLVCSQNGFCAAP